MQKAKFSRPYFNNITPKTSCIQILYIFKHFDAWLNWNFFCLTKIACHYCSVMSHDKFSKRTSFFPFFDNVHNPRRFLPNTNNCWCKAVFCCGGFETWFFKRYSHLWAFLMSIDSKILSRLWNIFWTINFKCDDYH